MISYIVLYGLVVAAYFSNTHFQPIMESLAGRTYNGIPLFIYLNVAYVAITTLILIRVCLNPMLKDRKTVFIINVVCVFISTAIYIFSILYRRSYFSDPGFLTLIWIADVINLVISIILFVRGRKANIGTQTD